MIPDPAIIAIVEKAAAAESLDLNLVKAVIQVESSWDPKTARAEPAWRYFYFEREFAENLNITVETEKALQSMSIGLMQVMGAVAREIGFTDHLSELFKPEINVKYGCKKLGLLFKKYPDEMDVVSAYNQGSPRKTPGGFYRNQKHVDKVARVLRDLRGSI